MEEFMESIEIVTGNGDIMSLPDRYKSIHLEGLNYTARMKISRYMNIPLDVVNEDCGHISDYNGLAELIGFQYLDIKNFERQKNPTVELLDAWTQRPDLHPTFGNLWKYLLELCRLDVLEDCEQVIINDAKNYIRAREGFQDGYRPIQEDTVSQSTETAPDHYVDETRILTRGDVTEGCPQYYDAFICYNPEGGDLNFVKKMIKVLENDHGLKLFVPWRDDLPGGARYVIDAKLIESRCRRMVIIISNNYIKSSACDFQVKFAHALSPGARSKKLIPVLIEPSVKIPQILRHVTLCDFTKQDLMEWFWDRLAKAIKAPLDPERLANSPVSSSSMDIGASSSLEESIECPGIEFPISGHQQVRSELESYKSFSSQSSMDCSVSPDIASSLGSSMGSNADSGFISSSPCPSIGSNSEVVFQRNTAVVKPMVSQPTTSSQKKGIFSGIFKRKKHASQHTSSHA